MAGVTQNQPPSADDPLARLERTRYSSRPAFIYAASVIAATLLTAVAVGVIGAVVGGPNCDAGKSSFLCTRGFEIAFPVIPGLVILLGCLGGFWRTYIEWRNFRNWRPWLAMCWVLMPATIMWMVSTFGVLIVGLD